MFAKCRRSARVLAHPRLGLVSVSQVWRRPHAGESGHRARRWVWRRPRAGAQVWDRMAPISREQSPLEQPTPLCPRKPGLGASEPHTCRRRATAMRRPRLSQRGSFRSQSGHASVPAGHVCCMGRDRCFACARPKDERTGRSEHGVGRSSVFLAADFGSPAGRAELGHIPNQLRRQSSSKRSNLPPESEA